MQNNESQNLSYRPAPSRAFAMLSALTVCTTFVPASEACTSLVLPATDGSRIYTRTMEFAIDTKSRLVGLPRHLALTGQKGLAWESKYAAIGMNAFGMPALLDGMNEKGLTGGILYFPRFAQYTDPQAVGPGQGLAPWEVLTWALTQFATVAEVKAALPQIRIMTLEEPDMKIVPPVHYTLHDATGASIVIEPVGGGLKVYDNPLGVMTNSPEFPWHMTNLRNYVNLTPASRFVRAAAIVLSAGTVEGGLEGVRMAEHISGNFDIPKGMVQVKGMPPDLTQWTSVADMGQKRYYIKTWSNPVLSGAGFDDFDGNGPALVNFAVPFATRPQVLKPDSGA